MNTLLLEFTEYNEYNLNLFLKEIQKFNFIHIKESPLLPKQTSQIYTKIEDIKAKYPNEWILLAEPKMKNGEILGGIVLFHHSEKMKLAVENTNLKLTKNYKKATHFYTGNLPKFETLGILKQVINEKI